MNPRCDRYREAISAQADGELLGVPATALTSHLHACASCQRFAIDVVALRRVSRVEVADAVPDQTASILAAIGSNVGPQVSAWRWALVAIGLVQLMSAVPNLFPAAGGDAAHAARHLAAFGIGLACSFFVVAWRPERASAIAPVLVILAALLVGLSGIDVAAGRVPLVDELRHVIALVGAGAVWMIGRLERRDPTAPLRQLPSLP